MARFAVLITQSANRVYGREAPRLALAELTAVAPTLHAAVSAGAITVIAGVEYLVFEAEAMDDHDRFVLSNLSGTFALFEVNAAGMALTPLTVERLEYFRTDLVSIQRYAGKTNEQFTHLLVNVATALSTAASERAGHGLPVRLLDPVAGRGSTLNRGLMYGFDVTGVELDNTDFEAYKGFLTTYLKDNRLGAKFDEARVRKGALAGARRCTVRIGRAQLVDVVRDDTVNAPRHFGPRSFDVLVGDLPYGVQHGSTATGGLTRSPEELVRAAAPGWRGLLRSGAGVALSWNVKTFGRAEFEEILDQAGFHVVEASSFDHPVDRSVTRGVVLATT